MYAPREDTRQKNPSRRTNACLTMYMSVRKSFAVIFGISMCCLRLLTGCEHLGPATIPEDRFDLSTSVADSWKQQTLLNIVKLRYMDLPVFVDVSSIVAGYSLQAGVSINGTSSSERAVQGNFFAAGGQAVYTDRPTITYTPMTGEKFLHGLITPIDPKNIFFMLQAGYPADFILGLTVESINGVRNRSVAGGAAREADPDFTQALELMREVQAEGAVAMRVEEDKAKGSMAMLLLRRDDVSPEILKKSAEIRRLLKLPPDGQEIPIVYSPMREADGELAVNSRSILQIMAAFSSYMDLPDADIKAHRAVPAFENSALDKSPNKVRIHCGDKRPVDPYVVVRYHDHWFWIDDGDWRTKRALSAVMFFFTLADTGDDAKLPLVTIPAQ
jgi:hypothetical protein